MTMPTDAPRPSVTKSHAVPGSAHAMSGVAGRKYAPRNRSPTTPAMSSRSPRRVRTACVPGATPRSRASALAMGAVMVAAVPRTIASRRKTASCQGWPNASSKPPQVTTTTTKGTEVIALTNAAVPRGNSSRLRTSN